MEIRGELPPSLFVRGVYRSGDNPICGGGFADIYKGTIDGKAGFVALKVLRMFDRGRKGEAVLK